MHIKFQASDESESRCLFEIESGADEEKDI